MEKSSEIDNKTHYNDNIFECEAESELCMALRKTINSPGIVSHNASLIYISTGLKRKLKKKVFVDDEHNANEGLHINVASPIHFKLCVCVCASEYVEGTREFVEIHRMCHNFNEVCRIYIYLCVRFSLSHCSYIRNLPLFSFNRLNCCLCSTIPISMCFPLLQNTKRCEWSFWKQTHERLHSNRQILYACLNVYEWKFSFITNPTNEPSFCFGMISEMLVGLIRCE